MNGKSRKQPVLKKFCGFLLAAAMLVPYEWCGTAVSAYDSTGAGLAEHALAAYNEHWSYSYGECSRGAVDCSGLIASYNGVGGSRSDMLGSAQDSGNIASLPNIHGLGLHQPGHVGVYVGGGMAVDARNESYGMVYESVGSHAWTSWFKVSGVRYPESGWESFNGDAFYYVDGQYVAGTTLNIDGREYKFGWDGALIGDPPAGMQASYSDSAAKAKPVQAEAAAAPTARETPAQPQPESTALRVGMQKEEVLKMKTRLQELGYYEPEVTDYFGEFTAECVKSFQKQAGLSETGEADQATQDALFADSAPAAPITYKIGSAGDEVTAIKTRLAALSYYCGEITDYYGEDTALAVNDFQAAAGIEVTGEADTATRAALYDAGAPFNPESGTLKKGMVCQQVAQLRSRLVSLRYMTGSAGTTFDDATRTAVMRYQAASGFEQTGKLDKQTLAVLYSEDAVQSPDYGSLRLGCVGEDVKMLQKKLVLLQYYAGEADGVFSEATEKAVKAFQDERGLPATGVVPAKTLYLMDTAISEKQKSRAAEKSAADVDIAADTVPLANGTVRAAAAAAEEQPKSKDGIVWILTVCCVLLAGMAVAYLFRKYPFSIPFKNQKGKYRVRNSMAAAKSVEFFENEPL